MEAVDNNAYATGPEAPPPGTDYPAGTAMSTNRAGQESPGPSSVLFVRNVPADCTQAELESIASSFGAVQRVHIMRKRSQAFVQLSSVEEAKSLLEYIQSSQPRVRGNTLYADYSRHSEINAPAAEERQLLSADQNPPSPVLLVTVMQCVYPVTVDVLQQVFGRVGGLEKVVIFTRDDNVSALVQFNSVETATAARQLLDGQCIYTNCNKLRVQFSRMDKVTVKYNNDKSRDFTDPSLPSGPAGPSAPGFGAAVAGQPGMPGLLTGTPAGAYGAAGGFGGVSAGNEYGAMGGGVGNRGSPVLLVSNFDPQSVTPDTLFTLFGCYGDVVRVKLLYKKPGNALVQFSHPMQASIAHSNLHGVPLYGQPLKVQPSTHFQISQPPASEMDETRLTMDYTNSRLHRFRSLDPNKYQNLQRPKAVLLLSNLPEGISEDQLREELKEFGPILSVRFIGDNHFKALVQFPSVDASVAALVGIHGRDVGGRSARATFSKYSFLS